MIPSLRWLLAVAAAFLLLAGIEVSCRRLLPEDDRLEGGGPLHIADPVLGYKMRPNSVITKIRKRGDRILYRVNYSIDRHGNRITPGQEAGSRRKHLLFFGCSLVFGQGVQDDQTLPYYVARLLPGRRVHNFAANGYGPQSMLARLRETNIAAQVKGPGERTGVYVYIDDHVHRAVGASSIAGSWGGWLPYYTLESDGTLIRRGDFITGRPVLTRFYRLIARSGIGRYYRLGMPRITDEQIRLTFRIITAARDEFKAKFKGEFIVVFFPGHSKHYKVTLLPLLKEAGIRVLEYGDLDFLDTLGSASHLEDGHPAPAAYEAMARLLARDLRLD
jgi:hypothetical protein